MSLSSSTSARTLALARTTAPTSSPGRPPRTTAAPTRSPPPAPAHLRHDTNRHPRSTCAASPRTASPSWRCWRQWAALPPPPCCTCRGRCRKVAAAAPRKDLDLLLFFCSSFLLATQQRPVALASTHPAFCPPPEVFMATPPSPLLTTPPSCTGDGLDCRFGHSWRETARGQPLFSSNLCLSPTNKRKENPHQLVYDLIHLTQ